jgi:hypothetical protein
MINIGNDKQARPDLNRRTFVLRLWRDEVHRPWRASVRSASTADVVHFAHIDFLFAWLSQELEGGDGLNAQPLTDEWAGTSNADDTTHTT